MNLEVSKLQDTPHANLGFFHGLLIQLNAVSTHVPGNWQKQGISKKLYVPRAVGEAALPSLLGMGINITANLRGHDQRNKIGAITEAYVDSNDSLWVAGFIWRRDFEPEYMILAHPPEEMGMSAELENLEKPEEGPYYLTTRRILFTGAAVCFRSAASYSHSRFWIHNAHLVDNPAQNLGFMNQKIIQDLQDIMEKAARDASIERGTIETPAKPGQKSGGMSFQDYLKVRTSKR